MADSQAGYPSRANALPVDPITGVQGHNQWLGHQANHHDDEPVLAAEGNRIPKRSLPLVNAPKAGTPDAVNPLGRHFDESYGGGDDGA